MSFIIIQQGEPLFGGSVRVKAIVTVEFDYVQLGKLDPARFAVSAGLRLVDWLEDQLEDQPDLAAVISDAIINPRCDYCGLPFHGQEIVLSPWDSGIHRGCRRQIERLMADVPYRVARVYPQD